MLKRVVFLDRDGTINQDSPEYIKGWSEFKFIPRSIDAIHHLSKAGYTVIIVTNQSAIARKLISPEELDVVHSKMKAIIESKNGKITDILFCPHLPADGCNCRKPAPGLIHQAQKKYDIDLSTALMIGDSARDIECAHTAGCSHTILVKTGNGRDDQRILNDMDLFPDYVAQDLYDAAQWIIEFLP